MHLGIRVDCQPTAWQRGFTGDEICTITTTFPTAETFTFIGRADQQPWMKVAAEDVAATYGPSSMRCV